VGVLSGTTCRFFNFTGSPGLGENGVDAGGARLLDLAGDGLGFGC